MDKIKEKIFGGYNGKFEVEFYYENGKEKGFMEKIKEKFFGYIKYDDSDEKKKEI